MPEHTAFAFAMPMMGRKPEMKPRPLMEAQAMELRRRVAMRAEPSDLKPGDLCVEKDGLQSVVMEMREGTLFILVRMLDFTTERDRILYRSMVQGHNLADPDIDCILAGIDNDGDLLLMLHKLSNLRRWPE